jgi:tetratricopeptide (TPR) repeat protein
VATKTQHRSSHHHELKEDVLVTWAFQVWDKIQDNLRVIGIVAGILVAAGLAVVWVQRAQARAEGEANRVLAEASANYWQGGYARAIQLADQVLSDYKTTRAANEARRMKGDALFWSGSFDSAATMYQDYLSHAGARTPVKDAVEQSLAFALESKRDFKGAAAAFEQLASTAPDRNSAADMLMCAARAYEEGAQPDKARALYMKVTNEYKDTTFGKDAEVFLGELSAPVARDTPHPAAVVAPTKSNLPPGMPPGLQMSAPSGSSAMGKVTVTSKPSATAKKPAPAKTGGK